MNSRSLMTTILHQMTERITIIGDGAMGTVCSILLAANAHAVTLWGAFEQDIDRLLQARENPQRLPGVRIPPGVRLTANESECFEAATLVVSAVPTQFLRGVWQRVGKYLPAGVPIVSITKGIENGTLLRPTQVIGSVLGSHRVPSLAALSGPNIAGEIARYLPATSVVASTDAALAQRVQQAFSTDWFRVYTNSDIVGVELAGAIKNVIAIAAGIVDGLAAGSNAKAALVTRGLVEISRLATAMGAHPATFSGLAGLGDLITTCISPEGRNRHVGEQIGKGEKLEDILASMSGVAEGVPTTKSVVELAQRYRVEMPITESVHAILFEGKDVLEALTELMTREPKPEQGDFIP
jgi:glycerol-3-phosphate dehydrogenase (NAD(P)+)